MTGMKFTKWDDSGEVHVREEGSPNTAMVVDEDMLVDVDEMC